MDLEELMLGTLEGVRQFREGQLRSIGGALQAGHYLTLAKVRLGHGEWMPWLQKCQVSPVQASRWMRLAGMGLEPEDIQERGGIQKTLAQDAKPRADKRPLETQLEEANDRLGKRKDAYYQALSQRTKIIREMAKGSKSNLPKLVC